MTTATEIWDVFESISSGFDEYDVPTSVDGRRTLIKLACNIYNQYTWEDLSFDKYTDTLNQQLDEQHLYMLAKCMVLKIARDVLIELQTTYGMNQITLGFKDYKSQLDARRNLVKDTEQEIKDIKFAMCETHYE